MTFGSKPLIISICGPTAAGKTAAAIAVAKAFNGEVISADSRQFYRGMNIGTAKPSPLEMQEVPHHFIDFLEIDQPYTAGDFARDATNRINLMAENDILPIVAGGSGLYLRALTEGLDDLPSDTELRNELNEKWRTESLQSLQDELNKLDPVALASIDSQNPNRVIRTIELIRLMKMPLAEIRRTEKIEPPFRTVKIGLNTDRKLLYEIINRRVDTMMEKGLEQEAHRLLPHRHTQALQTVGYREFFPYFEGEYSLEEAVRLIKRNTRRYAKRQLTWFRKDTRTRWFQTGHHDEILSFLEQSLPDRPRIGS